MLRRRWNRLKSGLYVPPFLKRLHEDQRGLWYPYCGEECEHCSGTAPAQWQVVTANIADDTCADCDPDLNDTWILDQDADISSSLVPVGCAYSYTLPSAICDVTCIVGFYAHDPAGYYWGILFRPGCGLEGIMFQFNGPIGGRQPAKPACAFDNEEFPIKSSSTDDCDVTNATCHVTAL